MAYMIFKSVIKEDEWGILREDNYKWDYFCPQPSFREAKQKVVNNFCISYQLWGHEEYLVIPSFNNGTIGRRMVTTITFNFFKKETFFFKDFVEEWEEYRTCISPDRCITYEIVDLECVYMLGW